MLSITNEKVAGFVPRWAEFRGFSILFDSPGDCLSPRGGLLDLTCDVDGDPNLGFYKSLRDSLARLNPDLLTTTYSFCPLPPSSYHVTVWDGGNQGNVARMLAEQRPKLEDYLAALPDAAVRPHEMTDMALASPLVRRRDWGVEFQFDELVIWGGVVMVARLAPTNAGQNAFERFVAERRDLNASFREKFGIGASEGYTPHVSLGYFANREGAQLALPCLREWNALFGNQMQDLRLIFEHASIYGFTDMATFFTSPSLAMSLGK
ncbi:hypothetical protein CCAX7_60600 [Capsulimonas corticalis]|uniref:Uncharacterized protein n=1 Tax=Capsulimonas corticalis TaxID=2219043 RepID=A0A402CW14_9BACT|nr:hypothetical protein [Capsulimonas corticalis]BDI34009.1 hypothetical protein CCAX7_60600 [Capsulimonas corticalis]